MCRNPMHNMQVDGLACNWEVQAFAVWDTEPSRAFQ